MVSMAPPTEAMQNVEASTVGDAEKPTGFGSPVSPMKSGTASPPGHCSAVVPAWPQPKAPTAVWAGQNFPEQVPVPPPVQHAYGLPPAIQAELSNWVLLAVPVVSGVRSTAMVPVRSAGF